MHHIIARGIERRKIFYDEKDRDDFLQRLGEIVTQSKTLCFLAVKEWGMVLTDLAVRLGISVPTVSVAVQRKRQIAEREKLEISALLNLNIKI